MNHQHTIQALALAVSAASFTFPSLAEAQSSMQYVLVRQDFSDCENSTVNAGDPSRIGGEITVTKSGEIATALVRITGGTPFTAYHVYWKCVTELGVVNTDGNGAGENSFSFAAPANAHMAFDVYPDGGPSGNKFQSTLKPPAIYYLIRQDFSDCVNSDVTTGNWSNLAGSIGVMRNGNNVTATFHIKRGTPNTTYQVFWKCVAGLGTITTDAFGFGSATFTLQAAPGQHLAFDLYPDGAPLGNKFQSTLVVAP